MNTIFIVLPILTLLMFDLGLALRPSDFRLIAERPYAVIAGLTGQIVFLPLIAFLVGKLFGVEPIFFLGIMLIGCSPGGSSSNVFSMLAGGDVALSVSLTAFSSVITLFTSPFIMDIVATMMGSAVDVHLPVGNLLVQNIVLMAVPIAVGLLIAVYKEPLAQKMHNVLKRLAFPLLILLASVFFIQNRETIIEEFPQLGLTDWHAECRSGHHHCQQSVCVQQRYHGYSRHHLCLDDECHPADVCRHHTKEGCLTHGSK